MNPLFPDKNNSQKLRCCLDLPSLQYLLSTVYRLSIGKQPPPEDNTMKTLAPTIKRRLEIQGFTDVDRGVLEETAPWLRLAYGLCAVLAAVGVILASPVFLLGVTVFSAWGAASPVHPFDYIYN
jgi:hypothetical protein